MSTKTKDTNTIQYDPGSKGVYSGLQPSIGSTLTDYMKNPLTASFFNQGVGLGQRYISQQGGAAMQALLSNFRTSGMGGNTTNPFLQSMIARQGRQTSGAQANNFLQQLMQARQMQLGATGMAQSYNPLMTGSTSVQEKSGLGTWLPQLIGTLGSAAIGAFTGGMGGGMGSLGSQVGGLAKAGGMSSTGLISGVFGGPTSVPIMGPPMMSGGLPFMLGGQG